MPYFFDYFPKIAQKKILRFRKRREWEGIKRPETITGRGVEKIRRK
jgi:hypothetical protein